MVCRALGQGPGVGLDRTNGQGGIEVLGGSETLQAEICILEQQVHSPLRAAKTPWNYREARNPGPQGTLWSLPAWEYLGIALSWPITKATSLAFEPPGIQI